MRTRGQASIWVLLLISTVILGTMAMAVDLGRMYTIQGELQTVADSASLAAATRLIGTSNSSTNAMVTGFAPLDTSTGNDNRFNLHQNTIAGSTDLAVSFTIDYFNALVDARALSNGGQGGPMARYARVDVTTEAPVLFLRFVAPGQTSKPQVLATSIAGIGSPLCTVSGSDDIAVTALDPTDTNDNGFIPGNYYTLYLTLTQQSPNLAACRRAVPALLTDTIAVAEYTILNHTPSGPDSDDDGVLFRLGATGVNPQGSIDGTTTGTVTIGTTEGAMPGIAGATCAAATAARDYTCGLNTRFGIDPATNACANIANSDTLALAFPADLDPGTVDGTLQDYQNDYLGNARRVVTVAIVDSSSTLTVLNFRQFLIEPSPGTSGVTIPNAGTAASFRGAVRAQYIGNPVPVRLGTTAGFCGVTKGVGKLVLF